MASGKAGRGQRPAGSEKFEKTLTRICVGLVIAGPTLGLAAGALGAAELYPSDHMLPVALTVMLSLIGTGLLIAACAGAYVLGGWKATPFGVALVAGVGVLAYGLVQADDAWRDVGVFLLAASCAGFWAAPAASPRKRTTRRRSGPTVSRTPAGVGGVFGAGAVIAIAGHVVDVWWVLLFGALAVGTTAGVGIGLWLENRREARAS